MNRIKTYSLITLIMDLAVSLLGFGCCISLLYFDEIESFINSMLGKIQNVDPESVVAGYEVIGGLIGAGFGFFGYLFLMALVLVFVIIAFYFLIGVIVNLVCRMLRKKEDRFFRVAKVEAIIQMILHGIVVLICFTSLFRGVSLLSVIGIVYCGILVYINYLQYKQAILN